MWCSNSQLELILPGIFFKSFIFPKKTFRINLRNNYFVLIKSYSEYRFLFSKSFIIHITRVLFNPDRTIVPGTTVLPNNNKSIYLQTYGIIIIMMLFAIFHTIFCQRYRTVSFNFCKKCESQFIHTYVPYSTCTVAFEYVIQSTKVVVKYGTVPYGAVVCLDRWTAKTFHLLFLYCTVRYSTSSGTI